MIKFFRKIRHNLLTENKFNKYFFYAIGEILLVVIGILIALQINNANENRKDREKEKSILSELNKDFISNLKNFEITKKIHLNAKENAQQFMDFLKTNDNPKFEGKHTDMFIDAFSNPSYNPSNGIVNSLISSGNFQLIQNDTLRTLIISWNDVLNDYSEEEHFSKEFWINKVEPYLIQQSIFAEQDESKFSKTVTSTEFKNLLARRIYYLNVIKDAIENEPIETYLKEIVRLTSISTH